MMKTIILLIVRQKVIRMPTRFRTMSRLALAGTSLLTLTTVAMAQDQAATTAESGATVLEEIVINGGSGGVITADGYVGKSSATGSKTDTPFIQNPQSISSVTKQQLEDRNPQTLLETIAYTPGTRVGGYGFDPRFDSFTLRGFDVTYNSVYRDNLRQPLRGSRTKTRSSPFSANIPAPRPVARRLTSSTVRPARSPTSSRAIRPSTMPSRTRAVSATSSSTA